MRKTLLVMVALLLILGGGAAAVAQPAAPAAPEPQLKLIAGTTSVILEHDKEDPYVALSFGTYIQAGKQPFEFRVTRDAGYTKPVVANQIVGGKPKPLPAGMVTDWQGLQAFSHLTMTNAAGKTVVDRNRQFCPGSGGAMRARPDAPARSPYPQYGCPWNPFTLGSVQGIQAGWATALDGDRWSGNADVVELPDGKYTAVITINAKYRKHFGIPIGQASVALDVTVKTVDDCHGVQKGVTLPPGCLKKLAEANRKAAAKAGAKKVQANPSRPTGKAAVPAGPKPDLRTLPAFGIEVTQDDGQGIKSAAPKKDYLAFSATGWIAGDSPMVVDGYRNGKPDQMDAFQYFFDDKGNQIGYAPVGTMEYDNRDGHTHWHFTDFAQYNLLDKDKKQKVRSGKEAYCLANTDAVDYTLPHAFWQPENTDLHTACGDKGSLSVRQSLAVGNGDTYGQWLPGQSFDISTLPNGTYYVQIIMNPNKKLYESNYKNNISYRRVILGGTAGKRTVKVAAYGLIRD